MWILAPQQPGGETHYLVLSKHYVVGRKNCDILLINDQSISRVHARLTTSDQTLTLTDSSKYGTFVNGRRVTENGSVNLTPGDNVTFGAFNSKFSVDRQKVVVCSSCLDNESKASLAQTLQLLGGKLVNGWSQDCTHLAMPTVKVTVKTISALLSCRPIVTPTFFTELNNAVQLKTAAPKAESFIPELDEPSLNKDDVDLRVIPLRKQLFTNKTFIFLSDKQLKRLSAAVALGGGVTRLLEEGSTPRDLLESPLSCVVDATTGSSQALLSSSAAEWANAVRNIVNRKGRRVITESEIGLAAIYASCDKYCNACSLALGSESELKVKPRIPNASLSQSVAVEETVLAAASQNVTAYAANTETSQRSAPCQVTEVTEVTEVTAVGETPEKKLNRNTTSQQRGFKVQTEETTSARCVVDETMNSESQRKKPESKLTGESSGGVTSQSSLMKTNGGVKTFQWKQSPQKPRVSPQTSPQKQSTLTSFFQPVNKKRPLDDEFSAAVSEPKRPALDSSIRSPAGSEPDLFTGRSVAHGAPQGRKRKEMEAEIQMEELESIMSEDMDLFDEQPPAQQTRGSNTADALTSTKRQRLHQDDGRADGPKTDLETQSSSCKNQSQNQKPEKHIVSIKTEKVDPPTETTSNHQRPHTSTANVQPFEDDDDASFIEDLVLLEGENLKPKEEMQTPVKPVRIKQEVQESTVDDNLPKKLVLVEFRSLTVTEAPKTKPKPTLENGHGKNFKCFRKSRVTGVERSLHVIGGSDLLVHNRGKNTDLDEWLKDAVEEERQNRRDESAGDDLFRYNPTKATRRR